jgi:hypothetical protein
MGATICPANEQPYEREDGTTGHYLESVAPRVTVEDADYGTFTMAEEGWEMHLTYGSVYDILRTLGYEWDTETYAGSYDIFDFRKRLQDALSRDPWNDRLRYLDGIVVKGMGRAASHISWA